ncbi:MAG: histidine kinase dimerization/phospho-acceptor domain-containing protein [Pseudomonadota bacterium]
MKSSLRSKISVAMWVMTAVSTIASATLTGALLVSSHRESVRQQLQATATSLLTLGISHYSELEEFSDLNRFVEDALQMDRVDKIIRIYNSSRKLLFTTAGADYDKLPNVLHKPIEKPAFIEMEGERRRYESLVMPYESEGNGKTYYLQVVIPLPAYSDIVENLWWQSLLLVSLLIGISVVLSRWLSGRLLKPVGIVAEHLQRMDPVKIEDWRPLELGKQGRYLSAIIDGINLLGERTQTAILKLRKMSRYVAHEMRTPLTILRGEAETALMREGAGGEDYKKVLQSSLEEIQRMSEIVDTVLRVGENAGVAPFFNPEQIDLARWVEENRASWERTLDRPILFEGPHAERVEARADPRLLYRMVDNLIRNVRDHAPAESRCIISLMQGRSGTVFAISDDGPGLADTVLLSLNKEGSSSAAAGVGLNLCLRIAEASGVRLIFSNRPEGGLKVEMVFAA